MRCRITARGERVVECSVSQGRGTGHTCFSVKWDWLHPEQRFNAVQSMEAGDMVQQPSKLDIYINGGATSWLARLFTMCC